jgi:Undecaprenyl-phosphate glucose phosphotransferase
MILRLKLYQWFIKIGTYLLSILAFYLGWWVWRAMCHSLGRPVLYFPHGHLNHALFGAFVWSFVSEHYKVTNFDELFRERTGARAAASACTAASFVVLAALYFSRNVVFPRGLLICDVAVIFALTILLHAAFRILCRSQAKTAKATKLLIVGANQFAQDSARRLQRMSFAPCEVVGFVCVNGQKPHVTGNRVYEFAQLSALNSGHGIDEAVIAIPPAEFSKIPRIIKAIEHLCIPVRAIVDLGEGIIVKEKLFQLGNIQMIDLTSTPTESLDYAFLKRIFDVCFSAIVLVVTFPIFALIAVVIRASSPGPIFFVQERVGLSGKPFKMYKFRTMNVSLGSKSDSEWTKVNDPRRTRLGSFLRKTSLDELPQFLNVLRGDMSVVGPRPERPYFVQQFLHQIAQYNHRHALKVGITGWAQVNGLRGDTSIEKRVEYDLYYLQNWSLAFDLRIIVMTLLTGLINKNAY